MKNLALALNFLGIGGEKPQVSTVFVKGLTKT
jgi:hypothetical protein